MQTLAVDFGTSNTVAALATDGGAARLVTIDGSPLVPSAVFLTDDGSLAVGRDADRQARIDPSRYEPNPKRRIDDGEILLGASAIPVTRVVAAVLGRVASEVRRQLGAPPDQVRLTHPARWGQVRKNTLIAAAREAGLVADGSTPILIPEPVAAATHFATQSGAGLAEGAELAVYDLGGGTFDVAVVQRKGPGYQVVAEAGLPDLGGLDFDHAIIEHIGATHARDEDPETWAELLAPTDAASRRLQRALVTDVRDGKEALSRYAHTDIALPPPFTDVHLTRTEFEELIRPNLGRSVDLLRQTVANAGMDAGRLAGIYLVGGSSRIPLVARLIQEGLGVTPTTLDQPETSVATGALYLPTQQPELARVAAPVQQPRPPQTGQQPMAPMSTGQQPVARTGQQPVAAYPASFRTGYPSGRQPEVTLGPPALAHELTPPPGGPSTPQKSRRRWVFAAVAVIVVAAAVAIPLLLSNGGGKGDNKGGGPTNSPSSQVSQGPTSPPPAGGCTSNFDSCINDQTLRNYIKPTYGSITSCDPNTALGSTLPVESGLTLVTCKYKNGTQVAFGKVASASDLETYRETFGSLSSLSGLKNGKNGTWAHGNTIKFDGDPKGSGYYWDNTSTEIFGMAASDTESLSTLQKWWQQNFAR
jgi:actin-like ATPase involved in cell morphogenesis